MDVYEALYTTRAMRRVSAHPVSRDVQAQILDAAIRAPSGGNAQNWRFILVDDPAVKAQLGPLYRDCMATLWDSAYRERLERARANPGDPASASLLRVQASAQHLADHFEHVPLFLMAFARNDPSGGSIFPAVWSAQLAARADRGWEMACCVSFGYPTGRWGVAPRRPVHEVAYRNTWGTDLGMRIPEPLWAGGDQVRE